MALLLALAGAKLLASVAVWLLVACPATSSRFWLPAWYYLALAVTFSVAGFALIRGGRREMPAYYLGSTFVLFGSLFADRVLGGRLNCLTGAAAAWDRAVMGLQPIAFIGYTFWRFAWTFPRVQPGTVRPLIVRTIAWASVGFGLLLFAGNIAAVLPASRRPAASILPWLGTETDEGLFWLVQVILIVPSLVLLGLKLRSALADQRRRLSIVIVGLAAGTFPMVVDVLLTLSSSGYRAFFTVGHRGPTRALLLTLFALLAPLSAAYAVAVEHVFDVRFAIRSAVRYSLARYFAFAVLAGPLVGLASYMYSHRDRPLSELSARGTTELWLLVFASAAVLVGARRPLLERIDRHFFREEYDARRILSNLIEGTRAGAPGDLTERICLEIDRALHLERVAILVRNENSDTFVDPQHRVRDLSSATALVQLIGGADTPLDADLSPRSTMGRLPESERQWLADSGARLLVPFLAAGRELIAILVLGDKRSDTPFTGDDRMLLTAVAASAVSSLQERLQGGSGGARRDHITSEPAAQCERCGSIQSSRGLASCQACRGQLRPCALPSVLAGKFAIDRQIGIGGMGVVYQAHDLDLARPVALKTLPKVLPDDAARLRREARAMATVQHPNLAVIYGTEVWRGVPVLVLEYLAGGTLADRLRTGPLTPEDAAALGNAIGDVLKHVHRAGLLHRDVKPSNIGYTSNGVPKLLDFGLARLTTVTLSPGSTTALSVGDVTAPERGDPGNRGADTQPLVGTAAYLSPEAVALHPPDHSFDLWALAVTLYEAVSGRNPFAAATVAETLQRISADAVADVRTLRPECPASFAEFLATALSPDARRRPPTAAEFQRSLQRALPTGPERQDDHVAALR